MPLPPGEYSPEQLLYTFGLTSTPKSTQLSQSETQPETPEVPQASPHLCSIPPTEPISPFADLHEFSQWIRHILTTTKCSDIYLSPDGVRLLIGRTLYPPPTTIPWNQTIAHQLLNWIADTCDQSPSDRKRLHLLLKKNGAVDLSWNLAGYRFRVNIFYTCQQIAFVLRHIPPGIRHFSQLTLPPAIFTHLLEHLHQGWLLIAGPSGNGKSTTLSACIEFWNTYRAHHILVIEDPIEYFYASRKSLIHQREVGTDTPSFAHALRSALRQSPQIIVIGEIRDEETARLALQAAETGHLVAATIHAPHAFGALRRLAGFFPESEQTRVWPRLVETFSTIIFQVLLPVSNPTPTNNTPLSHAEPQRLPAIEILRSSFHIRQLLLSPHCTRETISEAMERSRHEYMIPLDNYLHMLIDNKQITLDTALTVAHSPSDLKLKVISQMEKY